MAPLTNDRHETFTRLVVLGNPDDGPDTLGSPTDAYQVVYDPNTRGSARSGAHRLMNRDDVRARAEELREELVRRHKVTARDWWEDYQQARKVLRKAMSGAYKNDEDAGRNRVQAAREVIDRCEGSVKQMHDHHIEGQAIVAHVAGPPHRLEDLEEEDEGEPQGRAIEGPEEPQELEPEEDDEPEDMEEWFRQVDDAEPLLAQG